MKVVIVKLKRREEVLLSQMEMVTKKSKLTQMIQRYQHKSMRNSKKESLIMGPRKHQ